MLTVILTRPKHPHTLAAAIRVSAARLLMCAWGTDAVVTLAYPLPVSGRREVAVDACLAPLVQMLNDYGVHTTGCCCGHGQAEGNVLYEQDGQQYVLAIPTFGVGSDGGSP